MSIFQNKKLLVLVSIPLILLIIGGGYYLWSRSNYDPEEYEQLIEQATEAYDDQKYSEALDLYITASELAPRKLEPYESIVTVLTDKGRFEEASNVVKGVIVHLDPEDYVKLWRKLGAGYENARLYYNAFECFEQAYKYSKQQEDLTKIVDLALKGGFQEKIDQYIGSIESESESVIFMWNEYQELLPEETELLDVVSAARGYISDGYPYLAMKLLQAHEDKMENYWEGKFFLGRALYDLGEYEEAEVYFDDAISLGSDDATLYVYTARVNNILLEKSSAYNYYDRAVSHASEGEIYDFVYEYFNVLMGDEQYNRAEDLLLDNSKYIWSQTMLLSLYNAQEDLESFEGVLAELDQDEVPAYQELEYLKLAADYYLRVEVDLDKATELIDMMDERSWNLLYSGMLEIEKGNSEEGKTLLNSSIDADLNGEVTDIADKIIANL